MPNVTTHDGMLVEASKALRATLSDCYQVQSWLGVETQPDPVAAASAAIDLWAGPPPADGEEYTAAEQAAKFPRVQIDLGEGRFAAFRRNVGQYMSSGGFEVVMERLITEAELDSPSLLRSRLAQTFGRLTEEMFGASGAAATLDITGISLVGLGQLDQRDAQRYGNIATLIFEVTYGRGGTGR